MAAEPIAEDAPAGMTDLEERLRAPGGAAVQRELVERLSAKQTQIERAIRDGLPPSDFAVVGKALEAIRAARNLIATFPANAGS